MSRKYAPNEFCIYCGLVRMEYERLKRKKTKAAYCPMNLLGLHTWSGRERIRRSRAL